MDFEKCTFIVNYYSILIALWGSPAIKMRNSQKLDCNGTHTVNGLIVYENWRQQGETDFQYNPQFELENGRLWKGIFVWPGIEISAEESSHETLHSFSSCHSTMCSQKLGTFFFSTTLKKKAKLTAQVVQVQLTFSCWLRRETSLTWPNPDEIHNEINIDTSLYMIVLVDSKRFNVCCLRSWLLLNLSYIWDC